jgi:hypothetical protein
MRASSLGRTFNCFREPNAAEGNVVEDNVAEDNVVEDKRSAR